MYIYVYIYILYVYYVCIPARGMYSSRRCILFKCMKVSACLVFQSVVIKWGEEQQAIPNVYSRVFMQIYMYVYKYPGWEKQSCSSLWRRSRVTLGRSRVTLGRSRVTLGRSRVTLGRSRVTLFHQNGVFIVFSGTTAFDHIKTSLFYICIHILYTVLCSLAREHLTVLKQAYFVVSSSCAPLAERIPARCHGHRGVTVTVTVTVTEYVFCRRHLDDLGGHHLVVRIVKDASLHTNNQAFMHVHKAPLTATAAAIRNLSLRIHDVEALYTHGRLTSLRLTTWGNLDGWLRNLRGNMRTEQNLFRVDELHPITTIIVCYPHQQQ